jgi:hypothetical protein
LAGRWPAAGCWLWLTGRLRSRRWPEVGCRVRAARAGCCGSRGVSPLGSRWIWVIVCPRWTESMLIWLSRPYCMPPVVVVWAGRRDEHGADHPGASSLAGQAVAGVGPAAGPGAVGVVGGAAGWQQVAGPGVVDRCRWCGCRGSGPAGRRGGVGLVDATVAREHRGSGPAGTSCRRAGAGCTAVAVSGGQPCSLRS